MSSRARSWAVVAVLASAACATPQTAARPVGPLPDRDPARDALQAALFGPRPEPGGVRVDRWGRHTALVADGQVYASNGDDLPTMVGAAMFGMLASRAGTEARCAVVGLGSGVEPPADDER